MVPNMADGIEDVAPGLDVDVDIGSDVVASSVVVDEGGGLVVVVPLPLCVVHETTSKSAAASAVWQRLECGKELIFISTSVTATGFRLHGIGMDTSSNVAPSTSTARIVNSRP